MDKNKSLDCLVLQINNQDCFSASFPLPLPVVGGSSKFRGVLGWCCGR